MNRSFLLRGKRKSKVKFLKMVDEFKTNFNALSLSGNLVVLYYVGSFAKKFLVCIEKLLIVLRNTTDLFAFWDFQSFILWFGKFSLKWLLARFWILSHKNTNPVTQINSLLLVGNDEECIELSIVCFKFVYTFWASAWVHFLV